MNLSSDPCIQRGERKTDTNKNEKEDKDMFNRQCWAMLKIKTIKIE